MGLALHASGVLVLAYSMNSMERCILLTATNKRIIGIFASLALAEVNSYTSDHRWYLGMVFCVALPGNHLETPFILPRAFEQLVTIRPGPTWRSLSGCKPPAGFKAFLRPSRLPLGVSESMPATVVETVQPLRCLLPDSSFEGARN